ncbi:integrase core domain-containing protein [Desulfovibrio sp. MES5]|uniref:integrase core domain-containing protein n=1 Tax=Desulfovibrio sp. MES5 TaxID=1899016 RepID=UPI00345DBE01
MDAWAFEHCAQIEFICAGTPTGNGHIESVNGTFMDKCLNQNVFLSRTKPEELLKPSSRIIANGIRTAY